MEIHLAHVQAAEHILNVLRDPNVVLERVAREVGAVPPLVERLVVVASERARRPVKSGEQAVLMLGSSAVERETRALVNVWIEAMEQGGARIVPFPVRPAPRVSPFRRARGA